MGECQLLSLGWDGSECLLFTKSPSFLNVSAVFFDAKLCECGSLAPARAPVWRTLTSQQPARLRVRDDGDASVACDQRRYEPLYVAIVVLIASFIVMDAVLIVFSVRDLSNRLVLPDGASLQARNRI
eukprot:6173474-Pleurochrysis_carterae.AAC.8